MTLCFWWFLNYIFGASCNFASFYIENLFMQYEFHHIENFVCDFGFLTFSAHSSIFFYVLEHSTDFGTNFYVCILPFIIYRTWCKFTCFFKINLVYFRAKLTMFFLLMMVVFVRCRFLTNFSNHLLDTKIIHFFGQYHNVIVDCFCFFVGEHTHTVTNKYIADVMFSVPFRWFGQTWTTQQTSNKFHIKNKKRTKLFDKQHKHHDKHEDTQNKDNMIHKWPKWSKWPSRWAWC